LAGTVNQQVKSEVLEDLESSSSRHFIILFRQRNNYSFRGLYAYDAASDQAFKVYTGTQGPDIITADKVSEFYKYDSGGRSFKVIPTKSFGTSVHAIALSDFKK
jgi:hypothetical protein